jgi:hypothetical protein
MAIGSLVFVLPAVLAFSFIPSSVDARGQPFPSPPILMFLLFPLIYLVMGFVMTFIGCALYNFLSKYFGGLEYESDETSQD